MSRQSNLLAGPANPTATFFHCSHFQHPPLNTCTVALAHLSSVNVVSSPLRRVWDPGGTMNERVKHNTAIQCPLDVINNAVSLVDFHPGITSASTTTIAATSIFHCCHLVLSRPAVPNVGVQCGHLTSDNSTSSSLHLSIFQLMPMVPSGTCQ